MANKAEVTFCPSQGVVPALPRGNCSDGRKGEGTEGAG